MTRRRTVHRGRTTDGPDPVLEFSEVSGRGDDSAEPSDPAGSGGGAGRGSKVVGHPASDTRTPRQRHPGTYNSWRAMRQRCRDQEFVLDPRWEFFENFLVDMGPRPPGGQYTLDRADPADRRYGPGLCRWVSKRGQTRNRQNTVYLTDADGTCRPLGEWAELKGVSPDTLRKRRERGWSDPEVINGRNTASPSRHAASVDDLVDMLPYPGNRNAKIELERMYQRSSRQKEGRLQYLIRAADECLEDIEDDVSGWSMMGRPRYAPPDLSAWRGPIRPTVDYQHSPHHDTARLERLDSLWTWLQDIRRQTVELERQRAIAETVSGRRVQTPWQRDSPGPANEQRLTVLFGPDSSPSAMPEPCRAGRRDENEDDDGYDDDDEDLYPWD